MKDKEALFRQKSEKFLCCFNDACPQHAHCLRREVGQYVNPATRIVKCVSPRYQLAVDGNCDMYSDNQPVTMPVGMKTRFYRDMPKRIEQAVKHRLIAHTSRATYYKYHRGDLPITPDYLAVIQQVCHEEGWQGPLEFDSEVTDYVW